MVEPELIQSNGRMWCVKVGLGYYDTETYPLMQFTGLSDKNGREIYEGDVVMQTNHGNPYPSAVVYEAPAFLFSDGSRLTTFIDEAEVIGNIHENPDLLITNN